MDFWRHVVDSQTKRCRNIWQRFGLVEAKYRGVRFDVGEQKWPFNASYIRSKQEQTSSILYPQDCAKVCQCVPMVLKCARLSMCQFAKMWKCQIDKLIAKTWLQNQNRHMKKNFISASSINSIKFTKTFKLTNFN